MGVFENGLCIPNKWQFRAGTYVIINHQFGCLDWNESGNLLLFMYWN